VSLIAAVTRSGGIGKDNALLVRLPEDLAHFKRTTLGAPVIMGRRTWESIGRPLPGRRNVVITGNAEWQASGAERASSVADALGRLASAPKVFVIGGAQVYAEAIPWADELVLTEIDADFDADTHFPAWDRSAFQLVQREAFKSAQGIDFAIATYSRQPREA
jgi:dihydrofolate reductase